MRGLTDKSRPVAIDDEAVAQFAALGVAVTADGQETGETFAVRPENWRIVKAFLRLETQWRLSAGPGGVIWSGLDYAAAAALYGRRRAFARLMDGLRIMEAAALPILNEGDAS